ncbi:hypothetical protein BHE74_00034568, partial [Ensete ventricosum]
LLEEQSLKVVELCKTLVKKPPKMPGVCISSSLAASANGGSCGAVTMVNSDVRLLCKIPMNSVIIGPSLRRQELLRLHPTSSSRTRRMSSRVRATWPFRSNGKEMDVNIERSEAANEDILIFFFQLDLETRIQAEILAASAKALAYENIQYAFRLGQRVLVDVRADPNLLVAYGKSFLL